ncbi:MAG: PAS domain S-box protein [Dechloromonas sp.]|nr:PAS domain S-box protein [Dechloromonas sp.]
MEFSETDTAANNILLVGNATEHHLQITRFLLQQDYTVHSTKNIEEALIYIGNNLPDLILINLSPFDLCACALCAHLKSIRKIREIPVIFISQSNTHEERIQAFANGASDYITTPIIVRELQIRVSTHLALRSQPLGPGRLFRNRTAEPQKRNKRFMEKNGNPTLEAPPLHKRSTLISCLFDASTIGIVFWRRDGTLIDANTAFLRSLGLCRDDIANGSINMLQLVIPEERASTVLNLQNLSPGTRYLPYEKRCLDRQGNVVPLLVGSAHLEGDEDVGISFVMDLSRQKRMEKELRDSRQQLRELAAHSDAAVEKERKRISREIHDELGSLLTAMKMDISLLAMETKKPTRAFRHRLCSMHRILEDAVTVTRQIASELRPAVLNLGLLAAVEWLADNLHQRSAIACKIKADGEIPLPDAQATTLFRIIQESLTNIVRHANASEASIAMTLNNGILKLEIADNGCGFNPNSIGNESFGLLGIRERLEAFSGSLVIDSSPGCSTTLHITMPIENTAS